MLRTFLLVALATLWLPSSAFAQAVKPVAQSQAQQPRPGPADTAQAGNQSPLQQQDQQEDQHRDQQDRERDAQRDQAQDGAEDQQPQPCKPLCESPNLNEIAKYAIDASQETTETIKWVVGILVVALGVLGWTSLSQTMKSAEKAVKAKADSEIAKLLSTANEKLAATLKEVRETADKQLKESLNAVKAQATKTVEDAEKRFAADLKASSIAGVESSEALLRVAIAERWSDSDDSRAYYFTKALENVRKAQEAVNEVPELSRTHAWLAGMDAYIQSALKNYKAAIAAQLNHIELTKKAEPDKALSDWKLLFNLACYYTLDGQLDLAVEPLMTAISMSPTGARERAWTDGDLRAFRESAAHLGKVRHLLGEPPPAAPKPPAKEPAGGA
jgi:hypothetical protein